MKTEDFNINTECFFNRCKDTVKTKGNVYGGEDRLGQLKELAKLGDKTPESTAFDLMSKHIIALKHMCKEPDMHSAERFFEYLGDIAIYSNIIFQFRIEAEIHRTESSISSGD